MHPAPLSQPKDQTQVWQGNEALPPRAPLPHALCLSAAGRELSTALSLAVLPPVLAHAWPKLLAVVLGGITSLLLLAGFCIFSAKCWHRRVSEPPQTHSSPCGALAHLRPVWQQGYPVSVTCFCSGSLGPLLSNLTASWAPSQIPRGGRDRKAQS